MPHGVTQYPQSLGFSKIYLEIPAARCGILTKVQMWTNARHGTVILFFHYFDLHASL